MENQLQSQQFQTFNPFGSAFPQKLFIEFGEQNKENTHQGDIQNGGYWTQFNQNYNKELRKISEKNEDTSENEDLDSESSTGEEVDEDEIQSDDISDKKRLQDNEKKIEKTFKESKVYMILLNFIEKKLNQKVNVKKQKKILKQQLQQAFGDKFTSDMMKPNKFQVIDIITELRGNNYYKFVVSMENQLAEYLVHKQEFVYEQNLIIYFSFQQKKKLPKLSQLAQQCNANKKMQTMISSQNKIKKQKLQKYLMDNEGEKQEIEELVVPVVDQIQQEQEEQIQEIQETKSNSTDSNDTFKMKSCFSLEQIQKIIAENNQLKRDNQLLKEEITNKDKQMEILKGEKQRDQDEIKMIKGLYMNELIKNKKEKFISNIPKQ